MKKNGLCILLQKRKGAGFNLSLSRHWYAHRRIRRKPTPKRGLLTYHPVCVQKLPVFDNRNQSESVNMFYWLRNVNIIKISKKTLISGTLFSGNVRVSESATLLDEKEGSVKP